MCSLAWRPNHIRSALLFACAGLVTRCGGVTESQVVVNTEACAILYTQIEDEKDPLHIMFLINECMATLTNELPGVQKADKEDMEAIDKYSTKFRALVTNLRNTGNDVQGHFGGKKIQVGGSQYESLAARTHNEFVHRVDKEMSSLYNWMKDTWSKEPIYDWAGVKVETDYDEGGNSKAFHVVDVDSSKAKHADKEGRAELLDKARQRGWGKSHVKHDARQIEAYSHSYNIHNQHMDLASGEYSITPGGCAAIEGVRTKLTVDSNHLCPTVRLKYEGVSNATDYTFTVANKGMGDIAASTITLPKSIKTHLTDVWPAYHVSTAGCDVTGSQAVAKFGLESSDDCDKVKLRWKGESRGNDYVFEVENGGGGAKRVGEEVTLPKTLKTHLHYEAI